jgi:hypothetical protein
MPRKSRPELPSTSETLLSYHEIRGNEREGAVIGTSPASGGRRVWMAVILGLLMLGALGLRLSGVWQRLPQGSDELAVQLVGDEIGYEALADALLHGSFFHSPMRGPVYPLFIAAVSAILGERSHAKLLYVQAFVGVAALGALGFLALCRQIRPLGPLITMCTYFTLVHIITWAEMRYSAPLHPLLAIFLLTAGRVGYGRLTAMHQQEKTCEQRP